MIRGSILTAFSAVILLTAPARAEYPQINQPAPNFTASTLDGKDVSLADFKGQVLIVNFWATWCGPCKRELPLLEAYYRAMASHGLRILAITTEDSLPLSDLKPITDQLTLETARHFHGIYKPIQGTLPTNYVIDRAGIVRYAKATAFDLDSLNALLVPLLNEPVPAAQKPN
jgi:cytochrome c biogenesis protein CcmG/thiol:disulfide interchange protein DsbE